MYAGAPEREPEVQRVRLLTRQFPIAPAAPFNDLAQPACLVRPQLGRIRQQLVESLALPVHITGSGSTLFVIAPDRTTAAGLVRQVKETTGLPAVVTRSCPIAPTANPPS